MMKLTKVFHLKQETQLRDEIGDIGTVTPSDDEIINVEQDESDSVLEASDE